MYRSITLPNGAKLLTEFVPGARTAALGFFVGTGLPPRARRGERRGPLY